MSDDPTGADETMTVFDFGQHMAGKYAITEITYTRDQGGSVTIDQRHIATFTTAEAASAECLRRERLIAEAQRFMEARPRRRGHGPDEQERGHGG